MIENVTQTMGKGRKIKPYAKFIMIILFWTSLTASAQLKVSGTYKVIFDDDVELNHIINFNGINYTIYSANGGTIKGKLTHVSKNILKSATIFIQQERTTANQLSINQSTTSNSEASAIAFKDSQADTIHFRLTYYSKPKITIGRGKLVKSE